MSKTETAPQSRGGIKCIGCQQYWPPCILNHVEGCPACGPDPRTSHLVHITATIVVTDPQPTRADVYETARDQLDAHDGFKVDKACTTDVNAQRVEFEGRVPVEHRDHATEDTYVDTARERVTQHPGVAEIESGEVIS